MSAIRLPVAIGLMAVLVVLSGCGGGDSDDSSSTAAPSTASASADPAESALVEAAEKEGKVVWYNAQSPEKAQEVIDGFEAKYDVDVEALRLRGSEITTRYKADLQAGNVPDAIAAADPSFFSLEAKDDTFMVLTPEDVPAAADYPADAIVNEGTTALTGITPWELVANTDLVDELPQTWEDVLKPEFKDQIIFSDPRVIPTTLGMTQVWYDELGPEFLERFAAQNPTVASIVPAAQALAAGEQKLLVATEPAVAQPLIDEGAPLETVSVTPINGTEMFMAISQDAPNPNAARLLMNYMLSPEGQELANSPDRVSPREDIPNTAKLPEGYVPADIDKAEENRNTLLGLLGLSG